MFWIEDDNDLSKWGNWSFQTYLEILEKQHQTHLFCYREGAEELYLDFW